LHGSFALATACLMCALLCFVPAACGQVAPINPPPVWGQVPSGTGSCSIGKSCADLAPAMIESALGASPLEENLRRLADLAGDGAAGPAQAKRVAGWAVDAMRAAAADEPHAENFRVPAGQGDGNASGPPVDLENVVAEIRGREKPDEFVLLGAHIDSGAGGGARDEVCNAAMMIDAERVIHASGSIPRRSIRFVLFADGRQGMEGPRAYAHAHRLELDQMVAAVAFDSCNEPVAGFSLGGRRDVRASVREALLPIQSLGVAAFTLDAKANRDTLDFLLEGVPTLVANEAPEAGSAQGSSGKIDIAELKRHVAIAAVTAYALADSPERVGRRQSRVEIDQLLKDTGLAEKLKMEGIWPQWEDGERGRQR